MFALLSLLFLQGMASEDYQEREEASARARNWGWVFAILAPDDHPNPEVSSRIRRAKVGYPHDRISFEYWLRKKDPTLRAWHQWVVRNHGSHIYTNMDIQNEIAEKTKLGGYDWSTGIHEEGSGLGYQFLEQFPNSGLSEWDLTFPLSPQFYERFDKFIKGKK